MGSAGASPCNLSDPRCNLSCNLSELGGGYPAGAGRLTLTLTLTLT